MSGGLELQPLDEFDSVAFEQLSQTDAEADTYSSDGANVAQADDDSVINVNLRDVSTAEAVKMLTLTAAPNLLLGVLGFCHQLTDMIFLGHLGEVELGSATLGLSFTWITGFFAYSLANGQWTLISQAEGAGNRSMMGETLMHSIYACSVMCIPVGLCWFFAGYIMSPLIGADQVVRDNVTSVGRWLLPGLLFETWYRNLEIFLLAQNIQWPLLTVLAISVLLNIGFNFIFVVHLFGFIGSPIGTSFARFFRLSLLLVILKWKGLTTETVTRFHRPTWNAMKRFLRYGVPSGVALFLEVFSFELPNNLAIMFGTAVTAAQGIVFQLLVLCFMVPFSLCQAANFHVGAALGAGSIQNAKTFTRVAFLMGAILAVLVVALCWSLKNVLPLAFTSADEEEVVKLASFFIWFLGPVHIADALQGVLSGVLRAIGKPSVTTVGCIMGNYVVNLPLALGLTFGAHMGQVGMWIGLSVGAWVFFFVMLFALCRVDWRKQLVEALENTGDFVE